MLRFRSELSHFVGEVRNLEKRTVVYDSHCEASLSAEAYRQASQRRVKIITGIRRCGKSFLLSNLYRSYLLAEGVPNDHIVDVSLDRRQHEELRNPDKLYEYVVERTAGAGSYYVFIDEIQLSYRVKRGDIDERLLLRRIGTCSTPHSMMCSTTLWPVTTSMSM